MACQQFSSSSKIHEYSELPPTRPSRQSTFIQSRSDFDLSCPRDQSINFRQELDIGSAVINEGGAYLNEHNPGGYSWDSLTNDMSPSAANVLNLSQVTNGFSDAEMGGVRNKAKAYRDLRGPIDRGDAVCDEEELDDVSTWSMDTIRQVASDIHQAFQGNNHLDDWGSTSLTLPRDTNKQAAPSWEVNDCPVILPQRSWGNSESFSLGNESIDQTVPIHETTLRSRDNLEPQSPGSDRLRQSVSSSGLISEEPRRRKLKMYQWPPQQDPKLEKKRLRAIKQWKKRQQEEQQERELKRCLANTTNKLLSLRQEATLRRHRVNILEHQLSSSFMSSNITDVHYDGLWNPRPNPCWSQP